VSTTEFGGRGEAEFAAGTVRGVRRWEVLASGQLKGAYKQTWPDGVMTAECGIYPGQHDVPAETFRDGDGTERECRCGIYGYWTEAAVPMFSPPRAVIGVIEGFGRVLIGDRGFRCAKARIVGLALGFEITEADPGYFPPPGTRPWVPPDSMFSRRPLGRETYEAMRAGQPAPPPPQVVTDRCLAQMAEYETLIGQRYPSARIFSTPEILLRMFPPTTDYIPEPVRCARCGRVAGQPSAACPLCTDWLMPAYWQSPIVARQPVLKRRQPGRVCTCPQCIGVSAVARGMLSQDEVRQLLGLPAAGPDLATGGIIQPPAWTPDS
jgi:hypothetical protein